MHFLSNVLRVCYFSILIRLMNGYLLFAANLDDFHAIAKKLVPETLADRLTRIASKPSMRENEDSSDVENSEEESSEKENKSLPPIKGFKEERPPVKGTETKERFELINKGTKVNFDELVERVKKRLSLDLKQTINDKKKGNNSKKGNVDNYNKYKGKDAAHDKKLNKKNVKSDTEEISPFDDVATSTEEDEATLSNKKNIKNVKVAKEQFNTEGMTPIDNEPSYAEENVSKHNKKQNNLKNAKVVKEQFNIEEMSPFTDEQYYKEDIFNKPKVEHEIKTEIFEDDYEDAMAFPLKDSKQNGNKNLVKNHNKKNEKVKYNKPTTDSDLYKKMHMTQKDSYEDYVTPAREDNIYAGRDNIKQRNVGENIYVPMHNEHKMDAYSRSPHKIFEKHRSKVKTISNKYRDTNHEKSIKTPNNYDYEEKVVESEDIKAKTENLAYDNDDKVDEDTAKFSETSKKSKFGTRLPTRHTYKMSTPNFVANLPVVVEKYNFNEPIPEADRERENLKYIGNPPASINKKVRLI